MIKLRAQSSDDKPVMIFGLTPENLERLRDGKPISFDLDDIGLQGYVIITFGETNEAIYEEMTGCVLETGGTVHDGDPPAGSLKKH